MSTGSAGACAGLPPPPAAAAPGAAVGHDSAIGTVVYAPHPIIAEPSASVVGNKGTAFPPHLQ